MGRPKGSKNNKKTNTRNLRELVTKEKVIKEPNKVKSIHRKKIIKPVIEKERDIDNKIKPKKVKKIKHTFVDNLEGFYFTSKIVLRIRNEDEFSDFKREYENEITINKNNKIGGKTYFNGVHYTITDVITNEEDLVYVLEIVA